MPVSTQKGFTNLLVLIIVLLGIAVGVYLVTSGRFNLIPHANTETLLLVDKNHQQIPYATSRTIFVKVIQPDWTNLQSSAQNTNPAFIGLAPQALAKECEGDCNTGDSSSSTGNGTSDRTAPTTDNGTSNKDSEPKDYSHSQPHTTHEDSGGSDSTWTDCSYGGVDCGSAQIVTPPTKKDCSYGGVGCGGDGSVTTTGNTTGTGSTTNTGSTQTGQKSAAPPSTVTQTKGTHEDSGTGDTCSGTGCVADTAFGIGSNGSTKSSQANNIFTVINKTTFGAVDVGNPQVTYSLAGDSGGGDKITMDGRGNTAEIITVGSTQTVQPLDLSGVRQNHTLKLIPEVDAATNINAALKEYLILKAQGKLLSQQIKPVPAPKLNISGTDCQNDLSDDAKGNMTFSNSGFTYITRADISDDPKFSTFYTKMLFSAPNKKGIVGLNNGFNKYTQGKKAEPFKVSWDKTYYVRLYNGQYSDSSSFSIPACQQIVFSEDPLFQGPTTQKVYLKKDPAYFKHTFADKNPGDSLLVYAKFVRKDGKEQNAYPFPLVIQSQGPCPSGSPLSSPTLNPLPSGVSPVPCAIANPSISPSPSSSPAASP